MSGHKRKPVEHVLYVPGLDHWHETDAAGNWLFEFVYTEDGPPPVRGSETPRKKAGDPVTEQFGLGDVERRDPDGTLHLSRFATIRPSRPKKPWPAVVLEGTLEVKHPNGYVTLSLPLTGPNAVPLDPAGGLHTYHLPQEEPEA